ncbi:MAG: apolipoprotein N-acyltransferase [Actinobacteria bacterium]|nr:apolipoprotein N-acyltransferase [Actinomycetota bacterium]
MFHELSAPKAAAAGALSGILLFLAFPPVDLGPVAFIALVPLALVFRGATPRVTIVAAWSFGIVFFGSLLYWIQLFGPEAYTGLVILQAGWVTVILGVARRWLPAGDRGGLLTFCGAFLAAEFIRAQIPFGGFTWGGLAYSQHDYPAFLRLTAITGAWGLTLAILVVNCAIAKVIENRRQPLSSLPFLAGAAAMLLLPFAVPLPMPAGGEARLALVQGNLPEALRLEGGGAQGDDVVVFENHVEVTRRVGERVDLVVWPESSLDTDPRSDPYFGPRLEEIISEVGAPFLVGVPIDQPDETFRNTSLFFGPDGALIDRYDKRHLVPFGEYIPARRFLVGAMGSFVEELQRVPRDGIPGREITVFDLPEGRFASVICFESTFPSLVRSFVQEGARLLVVSTNNVSFERTAASRQHLAFSQVRAAEHRMWVAHAALTGISAMVDPEGRVLERTELFEQALIEANVRFSTAITPYGRFGDWLPWMTFILMVGSGLARRNVRNRPDSKASLSDDPPKPLVVLPTFNEAENIDAILSRVLAAVPAAQILVVDDGSPDGTAEIVRGRMSDHERIHLLERDKKMGLGRAYIAGFQWGLERGFNRFVEMDSDFSHDPDVLPELIEQSELGLSIGSRYTPGGGVEGWSRFRHLLSRAGNLYARELLQISTRDSTSGFRCYRVEVLRNIGLDAVRSEGYAFQIDMAYRSEKLGFPPKEVPIVFTERRAGKSKMSHTIAAEALVMVTLWGLRDLIRGVRPSRTSRVG